MIPPWRDVLPQAAAALAPGGALHIVDFGDSAGLPGAFRAALKRWLALFGVHPIEGFAAEIGGLCRRAAPHGRNSPALPALRRARADAGA